MDDELKPRGQLIIGVCTSAQKWNVEAFIEKLESSQLVSGVKFIELPYNDLDSYWLAERNIHALFLCHSINNRRFAITNVLDALYDKFLPHARSVMGKENIAVIVHDFKEEDLKDKDGQMVSFRTKQPTAFECTSLQLICGKLDSTVQVDADDWAKVDYFLGTVSPVMPSAAAADDDDNDDDAPLIFRGSHGGQVMPGQNDFVLALRSMRDTCCTCLSKCIITCVECVLGCISLIKSRL